MTQSFIYKGDYRIAEVMAQRVFDGFAKPYGAAHPHAMKAAVCFTETTRLLKGYGNAMDLFERTLKMQETQLGRNHPDTLPTKCGLAATYASTMRFRDSASLLRQVLIQCSDHSDVSRMSRPREIWARQALDKVLDVQQILPEYSSMSSESEERLQSAMRSLQDFLEGPVRQNRHKVESDCRDLALKSWCGTSPNVGTTTDLTCLAALGANKDSVGGISGTMLHRACSAGDIDEVRRLLRPEYERNIEGGVFETPLCAASFAGHRDIVELLVHEDGLCLSEDVCGSALHVAVATNHEDLVKILLQAGAEPNITNHWFGTVLHEASMSGQEHMVKHLLESNADPDHVCMTSIFRTPLEAAAWNGNLSIVQIMIKKGAVVSTQDEGWTEVKLAAVGGHNAIMPQLISASYNKAPNDERAYTVPGY